MKEVTEILRLLAKAIEQSTVNTYQEQGSAAADVVFRILEDAEKRIDALDRSTEIGNTVYTNKWQCACMNACCPNMNVTVHENPFMAIHEWNTKYGTPKERGGEK